MEFEWDIKKEIINISKHGIDFKTAARVFDDPNWVPLYDENHSMEEERFIAIGNVGNRDFLIYVVYTERRDRYRIISARKATKKEEVKYYDSKKNN